jgi:hypothetical protein
MKPLERILSKFPNAKKSGNGWMAHCPAHDDRKPSLSISEGADSRVLVKCHAGCMVDAICTAVGMTVVDLMPTADMLPAPSKPKLKRKMNGKRPIIAQYGYCDEGGNLLFQVVRFEPKDFRQRRPKPEGGWIWNVKGVQVVPYRLPELLAAANQPVFIVEGEKDADNLARIGLLATCNAGGAGKWKTEHSAFLNGRRVIILPDNDETGRNHAQQVAQSLQGIAVSIRIVELAGLPDKGDVSDWIVAGGTKEKLTRLADAAPEWTGMTAGSYAESAANRGREENQKSTADKVVELALQHYRIGRTEAGEPFAVELDGPNIALMFRGSRDALRAALSRDYRAKYGKVPNSTALADALTALQGEANVMESEPVYLRVAEHNGSIVVDLGGADGRAVIVGPDDWCLVQRSPVLFRRTAATGSLPEPGRGGDLSELRQFLNVTDETWPLVKGWLVAALVPNIPHPILLLGGQQGTGKTTTAKRLVGIVDPSPAPVRSQPRDAESWVFTSAASWVVCIDNVSHILDWFSDALCRAVTGDGSIRRTLYTDGDVTVLSFRRVVLLTSIDPGALRGDLGDRVLLIDLEPIDEQQRRAERDLDRQYAAAQPRIFGALLDLLAKVLAELPRVELNWLPRMADFAMVLAAMDNALADDSDKADGNALDIYLGQRERIAETVVESDPVALAIRALVDRDGFWDGTATELHEEVTPERPPRGWPSNPQMLGGRLTRLTPALERVGILVERDKQGHAGTRMIRLKKGCSYPSALSASSAVDEIAEESGFGAADNPADNSGTAPLACPHQTTANYGENGQADDADNADNDLQPVLDGRDVEWV